MAAEVASRALKAGDQLTQHLPAQTGSALICTTPAGTAAAGACREPAPCCAMREEEEEEAAGEEAHGKGTSTRQQRCFPRQDLGNDSPCLLDTEQPNALQQQGTLQDLCLFPSAWGGIASLFGEIKIDFSFVAPDAFTVNNAPGWDLLMHHAGSSEC